jgi:hypothetical protein
MQKTYFHNFKIFNKKNDDKNYTQPLKIDEKSVVDINILLNRLKIEKKIENKKKIIFFSLITAAVSLFLSFLLIIK